MREPAEQFLRSIAADRQLMLELVDRAERDPHLRPMCETRSLWRKLVLEDRLEDGIRLRLHTAQPGGEEFPHDHRFPFATLILAGGYYHSVYDPPDVPEEDLPLGEEGWRRLSEDKVHVKPLMTRFEAPGTSYTLGSRAIHHQWCDQPTVTLFVRGPADKRGGMTIDPRANAVRFQYGHAEERPDTRQSSVLDDEEFAAARLQLQAAGVI